MGYFYTDECLEHHGIRGQKWGVRRFENKNGHLTAAGRKRYDTDEDGNYKKVSKSPTPKPNSSEEGQKKKGLTDKQKKMIVAGAAIAGTALAAYGGYKLYQLNEKAKNGLADDLHQKAAKNIAEGQKMQLQGDSMRTNAVKRMNSGDSVGGNYEHDKGLSIAREGGFTKHLGQDQEYRANKKDFTIKEKYDYLKKGKTANDDAQMKFHKELIKKEQENRSGIEKKLSEHNKSKFQSIPKVPPSNGNPYEKAPSNLNPVQKAAWNASVSLSKNLKPIGSRTHIDRAKVDRTPIERATVSYTPIDRAKIDRTPINMIPFNKAAKANDDYVNDLLKRNGRVLGL